MIAYAQLIKQKLDESIKKLTREMEAERWKGNMTEKQKPLIAKIDGKEYEVIRNGVPALETEVDPFLFYQFRPIRTTSDLREVIKWLAADENNVVVDRLDAVYPDSDGEIVVARDYVPYRLTTRENL
jgi:hypothetical protein